MFAKLGNKRGSNHGLRPLTVFLTTVMMLCLTARMNKPARTTITQAFFAAADPANRLIWSLSAPKSIKYTFCDIASENLKTKIPAAVDAFIKKSSFAFFNPDTICSFIKHYDHMIEHATCNLDIANTAKITVFGTKPMYQVNDCHLINKNGYMSATDDFNAEFLQQIPNIYLKTGHVRNKIAADLHKSLQNISRQWCGCYDVIYNNQQKILMKPRYGDVRHVVLTNENTLEYNTKAIQTMQNVGSILSALPLAMRRQKQLVLDTRFSNQIIATTNK